jgi:hypothetical protein
MSQAIVSRGAQIASDAPRFWLIATVVLAVAHAWLILASPMPPLHDYPGHLARIHIMAGLDQSPFLSEYYDYEWRLRHNLGADLIIFALAQWMPTELAGRLVVAAIPALTFAGLAMARRKIHGRVDSLILLAVPFVFGVWFGWGFLNFCLSIALALIAFALWVDLRKASVAPRFAGLAAMGFIVWVSHVAGWAVFGAMIFAWEFADVRAGRGWKLAELGAALGRTVWRCAPLALPILLMATSPSTGGGLNFKFGDSFWADKIDAPLWSLSFTWDRIDKYCVALLALAAVLAAILRLTIISVGFLFGAGLIFLAFIVSPAEAFGGGSVDVRFLTPFALVAATALAWRTDLTGGWRGAAMVALALGIAVVSLGRLAYTAAAFQRYGEEIEANLALIDPMPQGARVLALIVDPMNGGRPPLNLIPDMAVVRRDAYCNLQWGEDAGVTLRTLYLSEGPALPGGEGAVMDLDSEGRSTGRLNQLIAAEPLARFDYVWIVNTHRAGPVSNPALELSGATDRTALYRVIAAE